MSLIGIRPVHPGRGEPSRIELNVVHEGLQGMPVSGIVLTPYEALKLAEEALHAARIVIGLGPVKS